MATNSRNKIFVEISAENADLLRKLKQSGDAMGGLSKQGKAASGGIMQSFQQITTSIASVMYIAQMAKGALTALIAPSLDYAKAMETATYGMSGVFMSMGRLNGEAMNFNQAMTLSADVVARLNDEALRTAATSQELTGVFQAILAPALKAGMGIEQIISLTTTGVNAVKSLGLAQTQVVQEMRDLVAGGITPASSTLATALGLKDSDIKAARDSAEGLYAFLMTRLHGFEVLSGKFGDTLTGKFDQSREAAVRIGSEGFEPVFDELKRTLDVVTGKMIKFNETTHKVELNQDLIKDIKEFSEGLVLASKMVQQVIKDLNDWETQNGVVVKSLRLIANAWEWVLAAALYFFTPLGGWITAAGAWFLGLGDKIKNVWGILKDGKAALELVGEAFKRVFNGGTLAAFLGNLKAIWALLDSKQGILAIVMAIAGILGLRATINAAEDYAADVEQRVSNPPRDGRTAADMKREDEDKAKAVIEAQKVNPDDVGAAFGNTAEDKASDARRLNKAQRELISANLEAEILLIKDGLEREKKLQDNAKEDFLLSVKDYWSQRLKTDLAGIDAEIMQKKDALAAAVAEGESADTEADRLNSQAQQAKLKAEIAVLEKSHGDVIVENARKLADAEEELADLYLTIEKKLADMTGNTLESKLAAIEQEYKDMLKRFAIEGGPAYENLQKLVSMEKASASYDDYLKQIDRLKATLENDILPIEQDIAASRKDSISGQNEINRLTAEYAQKVLALLPALRAAAVAAGAKPETLAYLDKLQLEYGEMAKTTSASSKIIKESLTNNLADAFTNMLTGVKDFKDAFKDMANAVLADIARIIAQKWATKIVSGLGFAGGGHVVGAGTGTSDSISAWLSNGEYVLNAAAVKRVGLDFLDSINYGMARLKTGPVTRARFAAGGYVNAAQATASVSVPVVINGNATPSLVSNLRTEIENAVINVLAREARA